MKKLFFDSRRGLVTAAALTFASCFLAETARAGIASWDPQGTNPQNPYLSSLTGTWETANWDTTDQIGTSTAAWVESSTALFAVNSGTGTPAFTVTMNSTHTVAGIWDGGQTPGPCPVTINGTGAMSIPSGNQTFTVVSPGTVTISNVISGAGALVQSGSGVLSLYGVNTYSGGTTVGAGGTLNINGSGKLGNGAYAGAISDGGVLNYNSSASQTFSGIVSGGGVLAVNGTGTLTLTKNNTYSGGTFMNTGSKLTLGTGGTLYGPGNITNNGTFSFNNNVSWTLSGAMSGTGSLSVNPSGALGSQLTLSGANTYSGSTTISLNGQVIISSDNELGNPPASFVANQLTMSTGFLKASGTFTLNANRGITIASNAASLLGGSIQVDPGQTLTMAAPMIGTGAFISGSGEPTFGFGTTILTVSNTYTGGTGISTGTLRLGTNGALPNGSTLIMAPDANNGPTFDLNGFTQTIGPLTTTNVFQSGITPGAGTPTILLNGALTVLQTNTSTPFLGTISGTGTLTINGNASGKLTLKMANSYTGLTTVNSGTLDGNVSGTIPGNVTVNGGTLELDDPAAMAGSTVLTMATGVTVNLNYSGTQTISALTFGLTPQATGLWGAPGNAGATFTDSRFTGTGLLFVCPIPSQTITPAVSSLCAGATSTASVPATAGATYAWSLNNAGIVSGGSSNVVTYTAWAYYNQVTLNCVVTSSCGVSSAGGQNVMVAVNNCGNETQSTNVVFDPVNGATIFATGVIGADWYLHAAQVLTTPYPWPSIQSGVVTSSPFTVMDSTATNYPVGFYYMDTNP